MRPTPRKIKELHEWLKKEMPQFYLSTNYMEWEQKKNGTNCPPENTLWLNSAYIENTNDAIEILNDAIEILDVKLRNKISFIIKIEKHELEDTIYAKIRAKESSCLVLKNNVFDLLKMLRFSVEKGDEGINLIVTKEEKSDEKHIIPLLGKEDISSQENNKKIKIVLRVLELLFSHVVVINPIKGDRKILKHIFADGNERSFNSVFTTDIKRLLEKVLNAEFVKNLICECEEDGRILNPFAPFLRKDFKEEASNVMWAKEQGYPFPPSNVEDEENELLNAVCENKKFKSYLNIDGSIYRFAAVKVKDLCEDKQEDLKREIIELAEIDENTRVESTSMIQIEDGTKKRISKLLPSELDKYKNSYVTFGNLSEQDKKKYKDKMLEDYKLRELTPEDKENYKDIINVSEYEWLLRMEKFIKSLVISSEKNYAAWSQDAVLSLSMTDSLELKEYVDKKRNDKSYANKSDYDIIEDLAKKIDYRNKKNRSGKENPEFNKGAISEDELSVILGVLLNFVRNNDKWNKIVNQCLMSLYSKEPHKTKGGNNSKDHPLIRLEGDIKKAKLGERVKQAYLYDLNLAIQKREESKFTLYKSYMKKKYSNWCLSEEISSMGSYELPNDTRASLSEDSAKIGKV